jgi:hypothetical protein
MTITAADLPYSWIELALPYSWIELLALSLSDHGYEPYFFIQAAKLYSL